MNLNYQQLLPEDFADNSRVWIYQCNRLFTISEAFDVEDILKTFVDSWQAHGVPVKGYANLFFGQFIVLMADESQTMVSGCSTDSSVRVIKDIEQIFKVDMFNRQFLAFLEKERVQIIPLAQLNYALQNNLISAETIYFNNTVLTKKELMEKWLIPVKDSWLKTKLPQLSVN